MCPWTSVFSSQASLYGQQFSVALSYWNISHKSVQNKNCWLRTTKDKTSDENRCWIIPLSTLNAKETTSITLIATCHGFVSRFYHASLLCFLLKLNGRDAHSPDTRWRQVLLVFTSSSSSGHGVLPRAWPLSSQSLWVRCFHEAALSWL